jgi:hypothetical protein
MTPPGFRFCCCRHYGGERSRGGGSGAAHAATRPAHMADHGAPRAGGASLLGDNAMPSRFCTAPHGESGMAYGRGIVYCALLAASQ